MKSSAGGISTIEIVSRECSMRRTPTLTSSGSALAARGKASVMTAKAMRHDRHRCLGRLGAPSSFDVGARARGGMMKFAIPLSVAAIILAQPAAAKDTRFWNLTSSTVKSLELAPAGTSAFGPNQCANDPDGAVDHDERVKVTGVTTGAYDARLKLADGRVCMAKAVRIETGKPFSIEDKDLVGCAP